MIYLLVFIFYQYIAQDSMASGILLTIKILTIYQYG